MTKRLQTPTERELASEAARKERAKSPAVEFVAEEVTGKYEGEELQQMREQRNPGDRLSRLEVKHDSLARVVGATREDVAGMRGELRAFLLVVESERKQAHVTERVRLSTRARVLIALIGLASAGVTALITSLSGCN